MREASNFEAVAARSRRRRCWRRRGACGMTRNDGLTSCWWQWWWTWMCGHRCMCGWRMEGCLEMRWVRRRESAAAACCWCGERRELSRIGFAQRRGVQLWTEDGCSRWW